MLGLRWRQAGVRIITQNKMLRSFLASVRGGYRVFNTYGAGYGVLKAARLSEGVVDAKKHPEDVKLGLLS